MSQQRFSAQVLEFDPEHASKEIEAGIRRVVREQFRRRGAVVGLSGGIDSSVVAALCARALGSDRVLGLFMPEADSEADSLRLGTALAEAFEIRTLCENITPILSAARCYERRDEAIRSVVPEYGEGYKSKIVLPNVKDDSHYSVYSVVVEAPNGEQTRTRLTPEAYFGIVASTNFKQRTRKMLEYFYADRYHYAVAGTPNRLEYDQGFFVKNGDGAADFKPIAHLYKSQVYRLAEYLGVPAEICRRPPTTDTYPLQQSQEEFYFALPYQKMDLCLYAKDHGISAEVAAPVLELTVGQVERAYQMIDSKRAVARYLHASPVLVVDPVAHDLIQEPAFASAQ
jgi:NAD+ synthase